MPVSGNYDYWREREETQRQHNIEDLAEFNSRLNSIYLQMIEMATQEINAFYGKYASAEGITIAEAKRRVAKLDIEEYARKAAEYVRTHDMSESANAEMRLYNATMKINRLELLKANIGLYMCGGFSEIEKEMGIRLDDATKAEFTRLAGILGRTINNADKRADSLVNASFQNATYSDRIWMYQDALKDSLSRLLTSGMIQGKSPAELARELRREFDVSRHQAERLMRTELCRVQTEAQKLSYQRNGYTKYIYLALGANPCDDCLDNDGKVFKVDEMSIAVNAPPMHPNCMCSTAPYFEEGGLVNAVGFNEAHYYSDEKSIDIQELLTDEDKRMYRETLSLIDVANALFDSEFIDSSQYLNAIKFGGKEAFSGVRAGNQYASTIILSDKWVDPRKAFEQLTSDKIHIQSNDPMSIYAHEYGHYTVTAIALKSVGYKYNVDAPTYTIFDFYGVRDGIRIFIEDTYFSNNRDLIKKEISIRAANNVDEFIAECFSQHFYGDTHSPIAESVIEYLLGRWNDVREK